MATGALGLLVAGASSRGYSLAIGLLFTALAIVGWGTGWLHLVVGLLGGSLAGLIMSGKIRRRAFFRNLGVGLVGAIPPAVRCLRLPVAEALKSF